MKAVMLLPLLALSVALAACGDSAETKQESGKVEEITFAQPSDDESIVIEQAKALVDSAVGQPLLKAQQQSGQPVNVKITKADLDGQGAEDYIMRFENPALCQNDACPVGIFFAGGQPPYRVTLVNYSQEAKIWLSNQRVNGHAVLYSQLKPEYRFRWEWQSNYDADSYDKIYEQLAPAGAAAQ